MLSIITPVLNGAKFIEDNIQSIQSLDLPHEHIIVDGGSKDGTLEIVQKYPHLILIHQPENTGMYGAIHQGFSVAKGKHLAYVNCDDTVIKDGFEKMYQTIVEKNLDLVYSNAILYYSEEDKYVNMLAKNNASYFLKKCLMPFVQPSSIYSIDLYNKIGGLRFKIFKICGDLDMFQRMVLSDVIPVKVDAFSTTFLKYSGSLAAISQEKKKEELLQLEIPPKSNQLLSKFLFKILK